jgi:hypothetical protein
MANFIPRRFIPRKEHLYPLNRRVDGFQSLSGYFGEKKII